MTTLLESVKRNEAAARAAALDGYRTIIRRANDPQDGDAEQLQAAMTTLGLTSAELESDLRALSDLRDAEAGILSAGECEAVRQRAADSVAAVHADMRALIVKRVQELDPMSLPVVADYFVGATGKYIPEETRNGWHQGWRIAELERDNTLRASAAAKQRAAELRRANVRALGD